MSTNPYRPKYTETQRRRVASARTALIERFGRLTTGQPANFQVMHVGEVLEDGRVFDELMAMPAARSFTDEWRALVDRVPEFRVEHGARRFTVLVDHSYYLKSGVVPIEVTSSCVASLAVQCILAGVFLCAAIKLGA